MSLSSNLARVLSRKALLPGPRRRRSSLPPRRLPFHRMSVVGEDHRTTPAMRAALARYLDQERPMAPVERTAAEARRSRPMLEVGDRSSIPGNGSAGQGGALTAALAEWRRRRSDHVEASGAGAPPRWAMTPLVVPRAEPGAVPAPGVARFDLGDCGACGGPLRVAVIDLAGGSAALECIACGLRRIETSGSDGGESTRHGDDRARTYGIADVQ